MSERKVGIASLFLSTSALNGRMHQPPPSEPRASQSKRVLAASGPRVKKAKKKPSEGMVQLWSDEHAPASTADLAVTLHSGTVNRVRDWLEAATSQSRRGP